MRFCGKCRNILTKLVDGEIVNKCAKCGVRTVENNPEDTLMHETKFNSSVAKSKYKNTMYSAPFLPYTLKIEKKCPKCSNKILSYVILGDECKYYYSCECGTVFQPVI